VLVLRTIPVTIALKGVPVGYVFYQAAVSADNWIYEGHSPGDWNDGGGRGAPGPIAGAGLSIIAIGYGPRNQRQIPICMSS
jgi:hypothetical protein